MKRKKRRTRGLISLAIAAVIAMLIYSGIATPYPDLLTSYFLSIAVAVWGVIDIGLSLTGDS